MVIKLQDQVWRGQLLVGTKSVYVGGGGRWELLHAYFYETY